MNDKDSKYLKVLLMLKGVIQQDVANDLGLSQTYVSKVIRGKRKCKKITDYIYSLKK